MKAEDPYSADHGGDIISLASGSGKSPEDFLDFSSNINEFIDTGRVLALLNNGRGTNERYYPETDLSDLEEKFGKQNGVRSENITFGPGLTSLIYRSLDVDEFSRAVVLYPSFSEYERALRSRNIGFTPIPSSIVRDNPEVLSCYSYDFLFMANPDNPTGTITEKGTVREILKISFEKNAVVFFDEAFIDFCEGNQSASVFLNDFPNLIIGRTLTKISGFPGIRAGYTISSAEIAGKLKSGIESWPLNQQSIDFARNVDLNYLAKSIKAIGAERDYIRQKLENMGLKIIGTPAANYISFKYPDEKKGEDLSEFLFGKNIIIRSLKEYRGMDDMSFRVSVKTRDKNKILLEALEQYFFKKH